MLPRTEKVTKNSKANPTFAKTALQDTNIQKTVNLKKQLHDRDLNPEGVRSVKKTAPQLFDFLFLISVTRKVGTRHFCDCSAAVESNLIEEC